MSDPVTESDHKDLREQVAGLLRYVENLEERLDNQHQALADRCEEEFGKLHERLNGQPDLEILHKMGGIVDAEELEEQQVLADIQRIARDEL